jgi:hypothetical protein
MYYQSAFLSSDYERSKELGDQLKLNALICMSITVCAMRPPILCLGPAQETKDTQMLQDFCQPHLDIQIEAFNVTIPTPMMLQIHCTTPDHCVVLSTSDTQRSRSAAVPSLSHS